MISKTRISVRENRKNNPYIVETIRLAKKNNQLELAKKISSSARNYLNLNLDQLERLGESKVIIVGKILGSGDIKKKISVSALAFSEQAKEKLIKAGCEVKTIKQEMETNPKLSGVKII